jgi:hypothetical protein
MFDSGDLCGARNTQFEQEFLDLFRAETVSAYDWRDRIGDFCVADYLAGTLYDARDEIFYTSQSPLAPLYAHTPLPGVCAASQKRLLGAMYHVSAYRPRACNRSHVCECIWAHQQLAFRVCRCADSILSAGTRRRFRTSLSFDSVQMSHLVGSNCHGFTPLR